jgi:hypothetical protein
MTIRANGGVVVNTASNVALNASTGVTLSVNATNAVSVPVGTLYKDNTVVAWGRVSGNVLTDAFNVASATRNKSFERSAPVMRGQGPSAGELPILVNDRNCNARRGSNWADNTFDTVATERSLQRRNGPAQQRRQVLGQRLSAGKLLALIHDRNTAGSRHQMMLEAERRSSSPLPSPRTP